MTRPQIRLYWHYLQKRRSKELEQQAIVQWGYDPKRAATQKVQQELAKKWLKDPLFAFPEDIEYFGKKELGETMAVSRRFGHRMKPEKVWTQERADACLGKYGLPARRCSMNDKLWALYRAAKAAGSPLSLPDVKRFILIDIKRSKLYPPGWTDDTVSPPESYLKELQEKGLLNGILKEIDDVTRGHG